MSIILYLISMILIYRSDVAGNTEYTILLFM